VLTAAVTGVAAAVIATSANGVELNRGVELNVAVASNFRQAALPIKERFEELSGDRVKLIFGSTGRHYAQIIHGAPYDVFLAADSKRPQLLEEDGVAQAGSRVTYALGKTLLWSRDEKKISVVDSNLPTLSAVKYVAMANPKLAPYGVAAKEIFAKMADGGAKIEQGVKIVYGENVGQAFQFVNRGSADIGFISLSQLSPGCILAIDSSSSPYYSSKLCGSAWTPPPQLYRPITQQAVVLRGDNRQSNIAAAKFVSFLTSAEVQQIIVKHGYGVEHNYRVEMVGDE
ncbi:MAG: molybdate ABC transporter substrate-binding protein, partial [Thiotrichales bacterium]|nr:molybdate ABC transporter substrate-binding protein [Thiotrichales bacterium]MBT4972225.1 molybdate ABC transporter substrate-binding protein [Thiotrichales bacterium]